MRFKFQIQYQYATRKRTGTKLNKAGTPKPVYTTVWTNASKPKLINARTRARAEAKFLRRYKNVRILPTQEEQEAPNDVDC